MSFMEIIIAGNLCVAYLLDCMGFALTLHQHPADVYFGPDYL